MDDEHLGPAPVHRGDHKLVVIGGPLHSLHGDLDIWIGLVKPADELKHDPTIWTGEPIPKADVGLFAIRADDSAIELPDEAQSDHDRKHGGDRGLNADATGSSHPAESPG